MKFIVKHAEPIEFTNWKNQQNDDWRPTFNTLSGDEKKSVYKALKIEQGFICCYCERELKENDYHIEHLNPQHSEEIDPLDFSNMLCSCQNQLKKGNPRHCGNSKGECYDMEYLISPLDVNCEGKFKFSADGKIYPMDESDNASKITIEKLKLDIDKLVSLRNDVIEPFLDESLTPQELNDFVKGYLVDKNQNDGKFNEFYTTIKHLFFNS